MTIEIQEKRFASRYFALPLVEMAQQRGVHPDISLAGSKLFHQDLITQDPAISFLQHSIIINNIIAQPSCREISFIYGQFLLNTLLSAFGELLFNCCDINQLLRVLTLKGEQILPWLHFRRFASDEHICLVFSPALAKPNKGVERFIYEMYASLICGYLKWRCLDFNAQLQFPYAKPTLSAQYLSHLHLNYSFSSQDFAINISKDSLRSLQRDAFPCVVAAKMRAMPNTERGFLSEVHHLILKHPKVQSEHLAQILGVSPATFKRKLKLHGTSFVAERDAMQRQQAMFYVKEQGLSNEQAAQALQFNDITNFRRAFKRWTGLLPSQLRKV